MSVYIKYLDDCKRLNFYYMDHELSFIVNNLTDESLSELIHGILLCDNKKLIRVKEILLKKI